MEFLEHALLLPDAQNTYGCVPACVGGWVERGLLRAVRTMM